MMFRRLCIATLAAAALLAQAPAPNAELSQVQFVYLLPMGSGLDQYLANWLVRQNVYQVVTDPQRADAIVTDHLGASFQEKLDELYPPPPDAKKEEDKKQEDKAKETGGFKGEVLKPMSTFTRGRGNVFLVELKSRRVIWSIYDRPKSSLPDELDKTSQRIVRQLKKSITGK
jgi:hypothetical protein